MVPKWSREDGGFDGESRILLALMLRELGVERAVFSFKVTSNS